MAEETEHKEHHHHSLKMAVSAKIQAANAVIAEKAAEILAQQTIDKRINLVTQAYTIIDETEKEHAKIKPDHSIFDHNGTETKSFSKEAWERRKKVEEKIAKLKKHLHAALEDHSKFGELANIINQK